MNATLNLSVANSLVLCHFQCTAPGTTALNRAATSRAANAAGAAKDYARLYNTVLTTKGTAVGKALSLQTRTAAAIRRLGMPCSAGGMYLRMVDIALVQNLFDDAMVELDQLRDEILATYGDITHALRQSLGGFAHEVSIPSATEVAAKYTMTLTFVNQPAAISGPVLAGLADEVANRVRADSQRQVDDMLRAAHAGPVIELRRYLSEFADALRNADRFHVSHFDNVRNEAQRVKSLNVLGLPMVNDVVTLASVVADLKLEGLTKDERIFIATKAERAIAKADETLASLGL